MVNFNPKKTIKNPINLSLHKDFPSFLLFRENRKKSTKQEGLTSLFCHSKVTQTPRPHGSF